VWTSAVRPQDGDNHGYSTNLFGGVNTNEFACPDFAVGDSRIKFGVRRCVLTSARAAFIAFATRSVRICRCEGHRLVPFRLWPGGHEDLSTTQRYMHPSPAALDAATRLLDSGNEEPRPWRDRVER
jgi:hypothetical protein